MPNNTLTAADYAAAARTLGCEVAAIRAVDELESRGAGFDAQGRPTILFERHWFRRLTDGVYDASHPHLSHLYVKPRDNPSYKRDQWTLMDEARALDASAANQSASWGRFQIMGFNHRLCGCTVDGFVARMHVSAGEQLQLFIAFVRQRGLDKLLKAKDWTGFACGYNGRDHASNDYAGKLSRAYARHAKAAAVASGLTILGGA